MEAKPEENKEVEKIEKALEEKVNLEEKKEELKEEKKEEKSAFEDVKEKPSETDKNDIPVRSTVEDIENLIEENDLISKDETWDEMGVKESIKEGLLEMDFIKPSKIQSTTFPLIMKNPPIHLIAQAKNGAGKTGAFGLGILSKIDESNKDIQAIVFAHTRELVNQIAEVLKKMAKKTNIQVDALLQSDEKDKALGQVVVITPGHFDNVFLKRKSYKLDSLKNLVLDEADYMLTNEITLKVVDKTFKLFQDKKLKVQILFFSATYTPKHYKIIKQYYKKANMIELKREDLTLANVKQLYYIANGPEGKIDFIEEYLKRSIENERVIIFVNSRDFTVKLQTKLKEKGYKIYILMGGDMDPKNRDETIRRFQNGQIQILITTNLLARGYDEKLVKLVINFDIPIKPDPIHHDKKITDYATYLHRIGRTGRFGTKGIGLTLLKGKEELKSLKEIESYYKAEMHEIKSLDELTDEFKKFLYNNL
jgi:ATP-dependent RNA helicase DDX19/DBP5